mgnify:CR=1 FL=1
MPINNRYIYICITILCGFLCINLKAQENIKLGIIAISDDTSLTAITFNIRITSNTSPTGKNWQQKAGETNTTLIPKGNYTVIVSNAFQSISKKVFLHHDTVIKLHFQPKQHILEEVIISRNALTIPAGMERINIAEVKKIPSLLGEPDAVKALQFTPGVQTGGEGGTGFFVRGGSVDQNLFLYDGTPLYNVSHMFGLLSVFNPDVVSGVSLYKGGFPAKFGGRLSSVIDVESRDGNRDRATVSGGLGLIASRLTVESPFAKDSTGKNAKGSILISGRRTYADVFTRMINSAKSSNRNFTPIPTYYFYDFNGKLSYFVKPGQKVYISLYTGSDFLKYQENDGLNYKTNWSNTALTAGTKLMLSEKLSLHANIFHTGFLYNIANTTDVYDLTLHSQIRDFGAKADFNYHFRKDSRSFLSFGALALNQQFSPQNIYANANQINLDYEKTSELRSRQLAFYSEYNWNKIEWLLISTGLRTSLYSHKGKNFINPEPRLNLGIAMIKNETASLSFKSAYTGMFQYVHLISNNMASFPTDVWYPVTQNIQPQRSDAVSGGLHVTFGKNKYQAGVEGYYKHFSNVVEYAEGADILMEPDFENNLVTGRGNSYGGEFMFKKQEGKFTGSLAYTLSWSRRQFDAKNNGRVYFANFDRRHILNTTLSYEINKRAEINFAWIFASGNPFTAPIAWYEAATISQEFNVIYPIFGDKNSFRAPTFHHFDANFIWKFRPKSGESNLSISVYNLYNRRNTFFINIYPERDKENNVVNFRKQRTSLLPLIPAVSYNFNF